MNRLSLLLLLIRLDLPIPPKPTNQKKKGTQDAVTSASAGRKNGKMQSRRPMVEVLCLRMIRMTPPPLESPPRTGGRMRTNHKHLFPSGASFNK